jgi:hypothetical protein
MSELIHGDETYAPDASFDIWFDLVAEYSIAVDLSAAFDLSITLEPDPSNSVRASAHNSLAISLDATPRLNGEPTIQADAAFDLSVDLEVDEHLALHAGAHFDLTVDLAADWFFSPSESFGLSLMINIAPLGSGSGQEATARLLVDGVELPIKSFAFDAPAGALGTRLDVELARISDRATVLSGVAFDFQIGITTAGVLTWYDLISDGSLESVQHNEGWSDQRPTDQLSIGAFSSLSDKLNLSPDTDLIIYDPLRVDLEPENDANVLKDTEGNSYPKEYFPISDLTLHQLMQEILVERCGFSDFQTNLPNYRIRQGGCDIKSTFFSAIKQHIGMFDPLIFERDGVIWIVDATMQLPAGFPDPDELSLARSPQLGLSQKREELDGFIVLFSESDAGEYYVYRSPADDEEIIGSSGDPGYSRTVIERTFKDWYNSNAPGVVIRSELYSETKSTYDNSSSVTPIAVEQTVREYDGFNREKKITKTNQAKVPDLPAGTFQSLQDVSQEIYEVVYSPHPWKPRKQIMSRESKIRQALVAVDADQKYLGNDFKQELTEAHKAGNLKVGMTTSFEAVQTSITKYSPQPNGQTRVETRFIDVLRPLVEFSSTEVKTGDVELPGETSREMRVIVLSSDVAARSGKPLKDLPIGELPIQYGKPLARRKLLRAQNDPGQVQAQIFGVDLSIGRGVTKMVPYRDGSFGTMMIEGYRIQGSSLGLPDQVIDTQAQGVIIG